MRFRFIDQARQEFPAHRLCKVLGVSQSGYFLERPPGNSPTARRHGDVGACALGHALSQETYGSPRMTR